MQNNDWGPEERFSTTFPDANGTFIELTEVYNSNSVWMNKEKFSEFYDANNNEVEYLKEEFNNQTNVWEVYNGEKHFYKYDANNKKIEKYNEELQPSGLYEKSVKYEYFDFITVALGVNTNKNTIEAKLFPNPSTNGNASIQVNLLEASSLTTKVSDLKGSIIYSDKRLVGKGLNTIEINNLEQGVYVVELSTRYGINRTKLVVK